MSNHIFYTFNALTNSQKIILFKTNINGGTLLYKILDFYGNLQCKVFYVKCFFILSFKINVPYHFILKLNGIAFNFNY